MKAVILTLAMLAALVSANSVLLEVNFDLALNQESETGYTASHTVSQYLNDKNLRWMRYFHTLASGNPGNAPMRVALLEFTNVDGWADFEQRHLEATHILYDLFWINWRRVLWTEGKLNPATKVQNKARDANRKGGYAWVLKMSPKDGEENVRKVLQKFDDELAKATAASDGFIEKRTYQSDTFQSEFQYMTIFEFYDLPSLAKLTLGDGVVAKIVRELKPVLSRFSTTVLAPSADPNGGQIFKGGAE